VLDAPYLNHMLILLLVPSRRYEKRCNELNEMSCLMLVSMTPDLQKYFEDWSTYNMIGELKSMLQEQAHVE
jgi:hypothetical protein